MKISSEEFNSLYSVGTWVRYWPVLGKPEYYVTKTTSRAWELRNGEVVVCIEGKSGGCSLSHIKIL